MHIEHPPIQGLLLFTPKVYEDERGFFMETYNQETFKQLTGKKIVFVQDNHSYSQKGVLRGLHYQRPPKGQGKLVRVISGKILDMAVDLRKNSPTFGQAYSVVLSSSNKKQFWIPEGFAHGFYAQSPSTEVLYKTTSFYEPLLEQSLHFNDPTLNLNWELDGEPILSPKDQNAPSWKDIQKNLGE